MLFLCSVNATSFCADKASQQVFCRCTCLLLDHVMGCGTALLPVWQRGPDRSRLEKSLFFRVSQHKTTASHCKTAHHFQHALLCKRRWTHCWDCKAGRKEAPGSNAVSKHTSLIESARSVPANFEFLPHNCTDCTSCPNSSSTCSVCCPLRPG